MAGRRWQWRWGESLGWGGKGVARVTLGSFTPSTPVPAVPGTTLALKQLPKASTSLRGFLYEFCVGLSLGTHPAIVTAYGIGIESADSYSFLTEPVLYGDLITFIQPKVGRWAPPWSPLEFIDHHRTNTVP